MYTQDTVCAIATPIGEGGIAIIRISGNESFSIVKNVFSGKEDIDTFASHSLHYGKIIDPNAGAIDEVLIGIFRSPNSYTGEDMIEINSHGGRLVTKRILNLLINKGAKLAEPGEFTKRAFLNGKIDLTQAEAVSDIIHAKSDAAIKFSMKALNGEYGNNIKKQHSDLIEICGLLELELDFIEDDIHFVEKKTILTKINNLLVEIEKMIKSFEIGKLYKDGVKVVLVGKPNVGKSTILNSLLLSDRAIVSEIPGTTRDYIEENFLYNGILFRVTDTAGLRYTSDEIENKGINRAMQQCLDADIVVYIFDLTQSYDKTDWDLYSSNLKSSKKSNQEHITVFNKCDVIKNEIIDEFINNNSDTIVESKIIIRTSAKNENDINSLRDVLSGIIENNQNNYDDTRIVTNIRHRNALFSSKESLLKAIEAIVCGESNEFVAVHIRRALNSLGEISGVVTTEEILNNIFSKFCIGK